MMNLPVDKVLYHFFLLNYNKQRTKSNGYQLFCVSEISDSKNTKNCHIFNLDRP